MILEIFQVVSSLATAAFAALLIFLFVAAGRAPMGGMGMGGPFAYITLGFMVSLAAAITAFNI